MANVQYVRRRVATKNTYHGVTPTTTALVGVGVAALGAVSFLSAEQLAGAQTSAQLRDPDVFRVTGAVLGGISLIPLTIALVDAIRGIDTTEDLGEVVANRETRTEPCARRLVANETITLDVQGTGPATSSADGVARFSMMGVGLEALPEGRVQVTALGTQVTIPVAADAVKGLRQGLEREPRSAAGQALRARREAACADTLRRVSTLSPESEAEEQEGARAWDSARQSCSEFWSESAGIQRARFNQKVEQNTRQRALARCASDYESAESAIGEHTVVVAAAALETVTESCKGIRDTSGLAARLQRVQREQEAEEARARAAAEQAAERERRREEFLEHLRGNRVDEAIVLLGRNPWISSDATTNFLVKGAVLNTVVVAARAILDGADNSTEAAQEMCLARTLYIKFLDHDRWRTFVAKTAEEVASSDPLLASKVVKTLNKGKCRPEGKP